MSMGCPGNACWSNPIVSHRKRASPERPSAFPEVAQQEAAEHKLPEAPWLSQKGTQARAHTRPSLLWGWPCRPHLQIPRMVPVTHAWAGLLSIGTLLASPVLWFGPSLQPMKSHVSCFSGMKTNTSYRKRSVKS